MVNSCFRIIQIFELMKKELYLFVFLLLPFLLAAQDRCAFDLKLEEVRHNPEFIRMQQKIKKQSQAGIKAETVFLVPVVVHVLYKNQNENISNSQILSQIAVLNEDYRLKNADTTNVESGFSKADAAIEFCLANRDPNGNPTDGIIRTATIIDNIGLTNQYYQLSPIWDRDNYLNIWVCDLGDDVAGFGFPPGSPADRDGVVVHYSNFGNTGNVQANYDQGRTTTHEVGHWFNLLHPWGNSESCSTDDEVADTPLQGVIYERCPTAPDSSCSSKDMLSNFMGYVYDRCMGNFTEGQKQRMRSAVVASRSSILLSNACVPVGLNEHSLSQTIKVSPNPCKEETFVELGNREMLKAHHLTVFNLKGQAVKLETKAKHNGYLLNTSTLKKGIYFIEYRNQNIRLSKKLVVF